MRKLRIATVAAASAIASALAPLPLFSQADVSVGMSAAPNPVSLGSNVTYTVTIRNDGPKTTAATLTDDLAGSTTFVSCSSTGAGVCGGSGNSRRVTFKSLKARGSATVTLVARVNETVAHGTSISNTATVTADRQTDPSPSNNTATATVTAIRPEADLALSMTASPDPVAGGSPVTYTLVVTNQGPAAASSVTLRDDLPPETQFVSCSATGGGSCGGSGNARSVSYASLAPGQSETVTVLATASASVPDRTTISNTASVSAASPLDPFSGNNSATALTTVIQQGVDLLVEATTGPEPLAGSDISFNVKVTNNSAAPSGTVTVSDGLPGSVVYLACAAQADGVCGGSGRQRTVTFPSIPAGNARTVTFLARLSPDVAHGEAIAHTAAATESGRSDPNPTDNSSTAVVTALNPAVTNTVYHVTPGGSDGAAGTEASPFATVEHATSVAHPGDTLKIHAGTYDGVVTVYRRGTATHPIVLVAAGDGPAVLTADLPPADCASTSLNAPGTRDRTLSFEGGADHWEVRGLTVVGGIRISGTNPGGGILTVGGKAEDRSLAGNGVVSDSVARRAVYAELAADPADGFRILDNRLEKRGLYALVSRWGLAEGNEVAGSRADCGVGPLLSVGTFSQEWIVRDNYLHDSSELTERHHLAEGIRGQNGSSYNVYENNRIEHTAEGRGVGLDVNSNWNVVRGNYVLDASHGISDQARTVGNQFLYNVVEEARQSGMSVGGALGSLTPATDPDERIPRGLVAYCNSSTGHAETAFKAGGLVDGTLSRNAFDSTSLSTNLQSYWTSAGNTWDGSPDVPAPSMPTDSYADCF